MLLELDSEQDRDVADRLLLQVIKPSRLVSWPTRPWICGGAVAARDLRADQPEGLRRDAVSYCHQALQLFDAMDQQRFIVVISEVAALGQGALSSTNRTAPACSRICRAPGVTWPWPA